MSTVLLGLLLQATSPPMQVHSENQRGGMTVGFIGHFDQRIIASDLIPTLSTELSKSPERGGGYSLTLTFRNSSLVPIELINVRYTVGPEIVGSEFSYGRKTIGPNAQIDLKIAENTSLVQPLVMVDASFQAQDKAKTSGSFEERYDVPSDPQPARINPTEHRNGTIEQFGKPVLFGSKEELLRPKGQYVFTLVDDFSAETSGGFQTSNKYLMFDAAHQIVMFATFYDRKAICLAAPIIPRHKGLRRIKVYWDDTKKKGGLNVDGIEVNDSNGVRVKMRGVECTNKPLSHYGDIIRFWSN